MTVLGIDTATRVCSAAVIRDGTIRAERSETAPQRHAELLLPFVDEVMAQAKMRQLDLNAVAVSIGPGSFTGLRIGLSVAKGIAVGMGIPIIPVPTLGAAAFRVLSSDADCEDVVVILPARRTEYYFGRYRRGAKIPELTSGIQVYTTSKLFEVLCENIPDTVAGEGIERVLNEIEMSSPETGEVMEKIRKSYDYKLHIVTAAATGLMSEYYDAADVSSLQPLYVKEFESGSIKK